MKPMTWMAMAAALVAGGAGWRALAPPVPEAGPAVVAVPAGRWDWRPAGTWRQDGRQVDPPLRRLASADPLVVMRGQVTRGEYAACVAGGACRASTGGPEAEPQTELSYEDAVAYAAWLSDRTGQAWRLPTDAEWQRLAAERFADDAVGEGTFADRWLARYEAESEGQADPVVRPRGGWGANSRGVEDLAGNVWEWTSDCQTTGTLGPDGRETGHDDWCGARVAEGRHRAVIIDFVRDASAGGCAAGVPPDHLGVRLVRED